MDSCGSLDVSRIFMIARSCSRSGYFIRSMYAIAKEMR